MAQHGGSTTATDAANRSTTTTTANGNQALQGANAELLLNMMNCVDTSLFSPQQLNNWEQMKQRIKTAAEQNIPLVVPAKIMDLTKSHQPAVAATSAVASNGETDDSSSAIDYRTPLHREASIQDVLSCLLDQQAPSLRMMASSGSNVLVNSEMKNKSSNDEHRPTLKSLLSSNDFTMTEKKQSLNHLLSFIDSSFASHPEPMTDVYKESQDGNLRRLSSLHLMRSFLVPNTNAQSMGRTTSFEIIQSMLNATSNHTIQKPMTSQDSFRFQHLANVLESIEGDVGYDNEDYGGEEVVQVDNLDNLLDYQSPTHASQGTTGGFVNTQTMVNQSSRLGGFHNDYASAAQGGNGYQSYQQQMYAAQYGHQPELGMLGGNAGMMYSDTLVKEEPASQMMNTGMMQQQQQQYNPMSFQSAMMAATPGLTLLTPQAQNTSYQQPQATNNNMMKANTLQHQQYSAMLMQQQQQHMQQQQQQVASGLHQSAAAHSKAHKQDSTNGVQICSALGCNHAARVKGMCKLHGGGRRCKVEGCMKSAQTGHLCIAHGGGKPCHVEGCPKTAQSRGLCKQHGGGVRCKFEGCTKSCQSGGYCRGHGGGKRCEFPNCTKWAQKNGHCAKHAQEVTQHIP